jgi:hypothetical protein
MSFVTSCSNVTGWAVSWGGVIARFSGIVAVKDIDQLPTTYSLARNYPNPFNPTTTIAYVVPVGTRHAVSLRVFDVLGQEVATLVNEVHPVNGVKQAGVYTVRWDASNTASGVNFYRLQAGGFVATRRLLLLR